MNSVSVLFAADFINVSFSHFMKLLDNKEIPYCNIDNCREVLFDDLMTYKSEDVSQESGDYSELK